MLQAPSAESKQSDAVRSAVAPEREHLLHPRYADHHEWQNASGGSAGNGDARQGRTHLHSAIGNQAILRLLSQRAPALQTKLTVNQPGDQYEQEADRVADQVMRMPEPSVALSTSHVPEEHVQRKCDCGGSSDAGTCAACADEKKLQRSAEGPSPSPEAPAIVRDVIHSMGHPLDPATRAFYESRFGYDFGKVSIHDDPRAAQANRRVSARAFTVGNHIAFADTQYSPTTAAGRHLIAHELAHVVQQGSGGMWPIQRDTSTPDPSPQAAAAEEQNETPASRPEPPAAPPSGRSGQVKRVVLAETGIIMFETADKSYLYELDSWNIPEGSYTARVSIEKRTVVFNFSGQIEGGELFRFSYTVNDGQKDPASLLRGQNTVTVEVVPDIDVDPESEAERKSVACLLPLTPKTLFKGDKIKPALQLFPPIRKNVEWSLGTIPLGWFGWVTVDLKAGVTASGQLNAGYTDGRLTDICLFKKVDQDTYQGSARFNVAAAISPSLSAKAGLEASAHYVGLLHLASIKGALDARAKGELSGAIDSDLKIAYKKSTGKFSFVSDTLLTGAASMNFTLTAEAGLKIAWKKVWSEKWDLVDRDFGIGWQGGLRLGTDTKPRFDFGTIGVLADGPTPPTVHLDQAEAADPLAEAEVDVDNITETVLAEREGEERTPLGLDENDPLPWVWYKPLDIYPRTLAIPRAISPAELDRDDGPTPVTFPFDRENITIDIGVRDSNWPFGPAGGRGKVFQYDPHDPGDKNKDWLRDRFNNNLLAAGETLRGNGFDLDHVHEKQFGGEDAFDNLWPADYQENQLAGGLHHRHLERYRDTFSGRPPAQGGGGIEGRYFEIVEVKRASEETDR